MPSLQYCIQGVQKPVVFIRHLSRDLRPGHLLLTNFILPVTFSNVRRLVN
jgi:hypothetical protein